MSKVKYSGWGLMGPGGKIDSDYYSHYRNGLIDLLQENCSLGWWNYLRKQGYKIVKVNLIEAKEGK